MRKLAFLFVLTLFLGSTVHAQTRVSQKEKAKYDELNDFQKDLYKKELRLNEEEWSKFWPLYKEYQLKLSKSKKRFRKTWFPIDINSYSEKKATKFLNDVISLQQTELDLFTKYSKEISAVIGTKKTLILREKRPLIEKQLVTKATALGIKKK